MEPRDRLGLIAALVAITVAVILVLGAMAGLLTRYEKRPVQLTKGPYTIVRGPDSVRISEDMVLYYRYGKTLVRNNRSGLMETVWDNGTYVYDIMNHREYKVAPEVLNASISRNLVTWREGDQILVKNYLNGSSMALPIPGARPLFRPEIEGDRIVYADRRNDPNDALPKADIYLYNLNTGSETRLTSEANASIKGQPSLRGDMVVWSECRDGCQVHAYYLSNATELQLTTGDGLKSLPKVSPRAIAWLDDRTSVGPGLPDLFYLDLKTGREVQVTKDRAVESFDLWGNKLVWTDTSRDEAPGNSGDIKIHDISTNRTSVYFASDWSQFSAAVWGDRIVWVDGSQAGGEIFMMQRAETRYLGMDLMTVMLIAIVAIVVTVGFGAYRYSLLKEEEDIASYEQKATVLKRGKGLK